MCWSLCQISMVMHDLHSQSFSSFHKCQTLIGRLHIRQENYIQYAVSSFHLNARLEEYGWGLWYSTQFSTIWQLYCGGQFNWWRTIEYLVKTRRKSLTNFSNNVVSSTPHLSEIWTHNVSGDRHWLHMYIVVINPTIIQSLPRRPPIRWIKK